jgi:type IV pilus assembly protein PilM
MARPARHFALNLGMQTVSMAEFQTLPEGGLKMVGFAKTELIVDAAADATRSAQIEMAVAELRTALKAPPRLEANICLPSQAVFSRFVKLPGATAEDVQSIIGFEAQQNVPFPIDEVVWDHQIMGEARDENWDVALVAIKADQLTEMVDAVNRGGVSSGRVDVAPMALYNAFRFNYSDAKGCSLLVDLGARTTNLIFCESGRLFSRSIPIGGNTITTAIAKEFSQEVTLAERLKIERGSVGLGGAYAELADATESRLAKVIRNTMTRLHAEIARSINFYRTTQGGSTPMRVFICGGSAGLTYMAEFFMEKLQAPVEFFNPLRNVVVEPGVVPEGCVHCSYGLGELVGSALRHLKNCPIEISLAPPSIALEKRKAKRRPQLALAGLFIILTPALWWLYLGQEADRIETKKTALSTEVSRLEKLSREIDAAIAEQDKLTKELAPFLLVAKERSAWALILEDLAAKIPPRFIWITQIKPIEGVPEPAPTPPPPPGKPPQPPPKAVPAETGPKATIAIEVNGLYLDNPPNGEGAGVVDKFFDNLKTSTVFSIGEDRAKVITERTTPTGESWAYKYTLKLPLKQPITLP